MRNDPLIRYVAIRSWIVVGCKALCFATEDDQLVRIELDRETTKLLAEKIPADAWPSC